MVKKFTDPFVITKKTVYMQRVSDLVRLNHTRYMVGQIQVKKAGFFAAKMDLFYNCFADKVTAHRIRKLGFCTARLLMYHPVGSGTITWILLATPGDFKVPDRGNETWLDPLKTRVGLTGYELVRHIRPGNADPSWTWRYNSERHDEIREMILMHIRRHNTQELEKLIAVLWRSPGFAGVREQVKKFGKLIQAEWKRSGVGDIPEIPKILGSVRRLPDKGMVLSKLIKELSDASKEG